METEPRLSTAFSSFMMAFWRAIFWVPMACTMVTMEDRASGMAATARATANIKESSHGHLTADGQAEHQGADDHDDGGQLAAEVIQADLQRGLLLLGLVHQGGDLADLGVHAGAGDHHQGAAVGDQRAGEHHVLLIAQSHLSGSDDVVGLIYALALAGEGASLTLKGEVLTTTRPSATTRSPRLQHQQVAGHDVAGGRERSRRPG